jgi:hypothetical protein
MASALVQAAAMRPAPDRSRPLQDRLMRVRASRASLTAAEAASEAGGAVDEAKAGSRLDRATALTPGSIVGEGREPRPARRRGSGLDGYC